MEIISQIIDPFKPLFSPWVYGPLVFVLWLVVLNIIKTVALTKIQQFVEKPNFPIAKIIIKAVRFPLTLLILGSGIYVLQLLLALELKAQQAALLLTQVTIILSMVLFLDRLVKESILLYSNRKEFAFISKSLLQGLIRGSVLGFGLLIFLDLVGISITPILASLGIGSLAVALALQDTLANLFAGIYITLDQPVREGDFVRLESGEEGYIREVSWRSTRIQVIPDKLIIVPNQKLISTIVTNFYMPTREYNVVIPLGVHYASDLKKVEQVTLDVARKILKTISGSVENFEPILRYTNFDASSINFHLILRAKEINDQHLIKHEFIKALHERYKQEDIVIPYPTQTLDLPKEILKTVLKS